MPTKKSNASKSAKKPNISQSRPARKVTTEAAPTWDLIKTYFTPAEVTCMLNNSQGQIDLSSCASVVANAQNIYNHVATGAMPPGNPWPPEWVNNFYTWMNNNPTCS